MAISRQNLSIHLASPPLHFQVRIAQAGLPTNVPRPALRSDSSLWPVDPNRHLGHPELLCCHKPVVSVIDVVSVSARGLEDTRWGDLQWVLDAMLTDVLDEFVVGLREQRADRMHKLLHGKNGFLD